MTDATATPTALPVRVPCEFCGGAGGWFTGGPREGLSGGYETCAGCGGGGKVERPASAPFDYDDTAFTTAMVAQLGGWAAYVEWLGSEGAEH